MAGLPTHPDSDHHSGDRHNGDHPGGGDADPAIGGGSRLMRIIGVTAAAALVVLVIVLHVTGVIGSGSH